jgi:hypothetical protein
MTPHIVVIEILASITVSLDQMLNQTILFPFVWAYFLYLKILSLWVHNYYYENMVWSNFLCMDCYFEVILHTCLRSVLPKSSVLLCVILWARGLNAKDIHKKMFPVYGAKCFSRERFTTGWQTFRLWRSGWNGVAEVAEATVRRLLCCGFRLTGKAMGQVCQCWWRICREINYFFQVRISHVLRFISICDLFTDSPSYLPTKTAGAVFIKSVLPV